MMLDDAEILLIGGTGSLGNVLARRILTEFRPKGLRIYSRDEWKQWHMREALKDEGISGPIAWINGDIRDRERLTVAMHGANVVINAAAMKQVPACERQPMEAFHTNIEGAENVVFAAAETRPALVLQVSTDKAVYPINAYGISKAAAEKVILHGHELTGGRTACNVVRYGNVLGSRGSIVPLFRRQRDIQGWLGITAMDATRFWITLPAAAQLILDTLQAPIGTGKIIVPALKASTIPDLVSAMFDEEVPLREIGLFPGEKLHEAMISVEEMEHVHPGPADGLLLIDPKMPGAPALFPAPYASDTALQYSREELKEMLVHAV